MGYRWSKLETKSPIKIDNLKENYINVEKVVNVSIDDNNVEKMKDKLISASSDLEILFIGLMNHLSDLNILKDDVDRGLFALLKDDISGFLGMLDEQQNKLIEVFDGTEKKVGVGRCSAFRKLLRVALFGVFYRSFEYAIYQYKLLKETKKIKKDNQAFFRILFYALSINMGTIAGLPRRRGSSNMSFAKSGIPASWRVFYSNKGQEIVSKEYKDKYHENLGSIDSDGLFEDKDNLEDEDENIEENFE